MESARWPEMLEGDDEDQPWLWREGGLDELLREAPAGCLYCRLSELDEDE